jgi:hypothetical protein
MEDPKLVQDKEEGANMLALGLPIGLPLGIALGLALGLALSNIPVGVALGVGTGMAFSVAIGAARLKNQKQKDNDRSDPSDGGAKS